MPTMRTLYASLAAAGVARADQRSFWADSSTCEGSAMYAGPVVNHNAIENHQLNEVTFCERSVETAQPMYSNSFVLGDSPTGSQPHRYSLNGGGKNFHTSNGNGGAPGWVRGVMWGNGAGARRPTRSARRT